MSVVMLVVAVANLWPISRSVSRGDLGSVILLVALDIAMVVVWTVGERKRSAMARSEQKEQGSLD